MNTTQLTHPSHENLSAFNNGRLGELESAVIERHLAECETCCGLLKTLPNDTLVVLLSQSETDTKSIPGRMLFEENSDEQRPGNISPTLAQLPAAANVTIIGKTVAPCDIPAELQNHPRYRIISLIGRGGMGSVYEAEHRLMNRPVALKVIDRQLVQTPGLAERFQREMQTAARLSHPNIVAAHDAERADNLHFLVMELVQGQDLSQLVKERGKLPVREACEYVRQAAIGLQHAFERGMVHRDIKPQNLMRTTEGQVKILDFGLAQFASEVAEESGLTQVGAMMGTPDYMAPEQARDAHSADIRADIYALGCTLYYLLSGQTPFPQGTVLEKVLAHVEREPTPLAKLRNDIPPALTAVVNKLMAKAPADRYQTPADVAAALLPFTSAEAAAVISAPAVVHPAATQSARNKPRSPAFYAWLALAAFAFLGALGVIVVMTDEGAIEIHSEVDDVEVIVKQRGEQIDIVDTTTGTQIRWVPSGQYEIALKGDRNDIEIINGGFTLTRGDKQIVTLRKRPVAAPVIAAANAANNSQPKIDVWQGWPQDAPPAAIAPFDSSQAKKHQDAWAKYLGIPAEFVDKSGVRFNLIPPGEFLMGSPKEELEKLVRDLKQAGAGAYDLSVANVSGPQHQVRITKPFYMAAHEITVGEFRRFVDDTHYLTSRDQLGAKRPSWTESAQGANAELRAVIGVSWDDAKAYCAWRSKRDGVTIDLPTEAQWEYACRAGTTTLWSFGDDPGKLSEYAVFHQRSFWPAEVIGTKKANPFGLFDMHGNADEWCLDWHSSGFYAQSPVNDPAMLDNPGDVNSGRVARGGTSQSVSWWTRSTTRPWDFPATPVNPKGFRIVIKEGLQQAAVAIGKVSGTTAELPNNDAADGPNEAVK